MTRIDGMLMLMLKLKQRREDTGHAGRYIHATTLWSDIPQTAQSGPLGCSRTLLNPSILLSNLSYAICKRSSEVSMRSRTSKGGTRLWDTLDACTYGCIVEAELM